MGPPGHLAIALAVKPTAPRIPLWVLLVTTEIPDLLCFAFMATSIETASISTTSLSRGIEIVQAGSIPWSHGLFMSVVWSLLAAALAFAFLRDRRTSTIIGLTLFSHWVLDFVVHLPDLPLLFEGSPVVGLGLWGSGPGLIASAILEFVMLAGGIAVYVVARRRGITARNE